MDQVWLTATEWAIPYAIARLYLADADGPRRMAVAVVVAGLAYIPICWYETVVGPDYYLGRLAYGTAAYAPQAERLGGYRPEGFLGTGLELASWMSLATVMAAWLWASGAAWRPIRWALPMASTALAATAIACRGVYGYGEMAVGLVATAITAGLRTRVALMALVLLPPAYVAARGTGAWDASILREAAKKVGKEGTIAFRVDAEDQFVRDTKAAGILFGTGGRFPYWQADGWWPATLKGGGLVGLLAQYSAFLVPAGLVAFGPRRRFPARSVEVGLALVLALMVVDSLHNTSPFAAIPMIAGTLVGSSLAIRPGKGTPAGPARTAPEASIPIAIVVTLILLALAEALGRLPKTDRPGPASNLGTPSRP